MGQTASFHHHHQYPMDGAQDSPTSPRQVRQRVQQQQQEREHGDNGNAGNCCGTTSCSCGGGLSSTAALYGTTASPRTPVVVTPPRSLPHHHHHHQWPESPSGGVNPSASPNGCSCGPASGSGCSHWCSACRVRVQLQVECVGGMEGRSATSRGGRLRTLAFPKRGRHKAKATPRDAPPQPKKKKSPWTLRLNCRLRPSKTDDDAMPSSSPQAATAGSVGCGGCMCPGLRRPDPDLHPLHHLHLHHTRSAPEESTSGAASPGGAVALRAPVIDLSRFNPEAFPIDDWEERARQERAREMAEGVDPPPGFTSDPGTGPGTVGSLALTHLQLQHQHHLQLQQAGAASLPVPYNPMLDLHLLLERSLRLGLAGPGALLQQVGRLASGGTGGSMTSEGGALLQRTVHTQVDYIHCLVPDLLAITNCVFYWGKMDRYEAERLLDTRPEGTFLLRDSAQEEYLFSVSFRRYGRSLHARIEQWNHRFSFDSHDPGVFASDTVCGLIEHYKDPSCCMFFEPMLTNPLARTFPFPLQHLCRAAICSATTYDGINSLRLPKPLHTYLKEYHYKQRVRVRRLDH